MWRAAIARAAAISIHPQCSQSTLVCRRKSAGSPMKNARRRAQIENAEDSGGLRKDVSVRRKIHTVSETFIRADA
jgi:hypothetical protein